ncbi:MAG: hypothetical protein L6R39_005816 [Caloplaca ligustica]|nr:MAG: hypothetical protein L6R39_005816 [Caloplaca ligustica]
MCRAAVLRCPRAGGKTEEITIHSGIRADVGAKIDRATRAVNRKLPFGIALPSAGCERCHKGHELSKLILAEKINKIEKLVAIVEDMEEATAAEDRGEPAADSGRKGQDQSAKHLLELLRAQSVTGVMLVHGPFVPSSSSGAA